MGNNLSDTPLHFWSIAANKLGIDSALIATTHGTCGVHIGRFTSKLEEVSCPDCLNRINSKESNGSQAAG